MIFSLIKDVLGFAWRHRRFFLKTITPMLFILVIIFEMSGVNTLVMNMMSQAADVQEHGQSPEAGLGAEKDLSNDNSGTGQNQQPVHDENTNNTDTNTNGNSDGDGKSINAEVSGLSATGVALFIVYLLGSIYPAAIVIHYVRSIFTAEEINGAKLHSQASALWGKMLGLYLLVWGGLILMFAGIYGILHLLGLAVAGGTLIVSMLMGFGLYIHHRLSLAPFFCANTDMDIIDALKASWAKAQGYVFTLVMGHVFLYIAVLISLTLVGQILQSIVSESMIGGVQFVISVLAGFGGVLQTVYVYRVYSYILEKNE